MELEAEVAKLKEENEELKQKQVISRLLLNSSHTCQHMSRWAFSYAKHFCHYSSCSLVFAGRNDRNAEEPGT